ncbi:MAG: hypothetical protein AAF690_22890 [Acidobacteriota bacterium]
MEKIFKLAVIVILLAVGYSFGRPYLEGLFEEVDSLGAGGAGSCSRSIERARDNFADKMAKVTPPVQVERWNSDLAMARGRLGRARAACECPGEGCDAGRSALDALERLMTNWDDAIQRDKAPPLNGARGLERVDELVREARSKGA